MHLYINEQQEEKLDPSESYQFGLKKKHKNAGTWDSTYYLHVCADTD